MTLLPYCIQLLTAKSFGYVKILVYICNANLHFMHNRLKQFLSAENITQAQFASTINIGRANISHVLSGRNKPGYDFIKAIMAAYPTLNMEWLILGKGKMYKDTVVEPTTNTSEHDFMMDSTEPELFDDRNFLDHQVPISPAAAEISAPTLPSPAQISQTITSITPTQTVVNQRKVVKVTIFFDDGTYQEM